MADFPASFIPNDADLDECRKHRKENGLTTEIGKIDCIMECPVNETCPVNPKRKEA